MKRNNRGDARFSIKDYEKAIENLKAGMTQLKPDGDNCHICGDSGHQAFECHHNPLIHSERFWDSLTEWRCFHCNQVFTEEAEAAKHFGKPMPHCTKVGERGKGILCLSQ